MNLWDKVTGNDMRKVYLDFDARAHQLPVEYQAAWEGVKAYLWPHADFSGRNLIPILGGVLGLLEESAAEGLGIEAVFGGDIKGFCADLVEGEGAKSYRAKLRAQLNDNIAHKLGK